MLKTGWRPPERFAAKGRDGKTDIFGIIIRPSSFDPNRPYPVIEQIYAGPHYEEQSNVTQAHKLQGKLLLTVAELDRNVDPASTMQVVNALIKADKDFELLVVPGAGHGAGGSPYGQRRQQDFFVRHLLGVEPRSAP